MCASQGLGPGDEHQLHPPVGQRSACPAETPLRIRELHFRLKFRAPCRSTSTRPAGSPEREERCAAGKVSSELWQGWQSVATQ